MKAQASVEFLLLVGILTLIFVILVNYSGGYQFQSSTLRLQEHYTEICNQIKNEITYALAIGPYYEREFYLPSGTYNAAIVEYTILIEYSNGEVDCFSPVNLTEELNIGRNVLIYNESGIFFE